MPEIDFGNLLGVLGIALVAPLALGLAPRLKVPAVVLEIALGVSVGPSALGWLAPDLAVQIVALLGLAMLLFLAGLEVDLRALRGGLLPLAAAGYAVSLLLGWIAGLSMQAAGWVRDPLLLAVARVAGGDPGVAERHSVELTLFSIDADGTCGRGPARASSVVQAGPRCGALRV